METKEKKSCVCPSVYLTYFTLCRCGPNFTERADFVQRFLRPYISGSDAVWSRAVSVCSNIKITTYLSCTLHDWGLYKFSEQILLQALLGISRLVMIQGEHKNTPWFQVVIKSKLTGIFLQNWWLQLHKLIQIHVVSHTHTQCAPVLLLGKHQCDNLTQARLSAAYLAWTSWQLQWFVPAAHPLLRVVEVHRLCLSHTPEGKSHKRSGTVISVANGRKLGHFVQRGRCVAVKWAPSCISQPSGGGREN